MIFRFVMLYEIYSNVLWDENDVYVTLNVSYVQTILKV